MVLAQSMRGLDLVSDLVEERFGKDAGVRRVDSATKTQQRQEAVQVGGWWVRVGGCAGREGMWGQQLSVRQRPGGV